MTRTLVVTRRFLTVGKPGSTVTMEELGWTDEQFDEFLDAGHGLEIHGSAVSTERTLEDSDEPTKAELYERAQDLDITGRSEMDKAELAEAIEQHTKDKPKA